MKKLEEYKITIDPAYAENGEDLGIEMIAFVKDPAVRVKGMAFHTHIRTAFADAPKMRIAAPALIPMSIYRNDEMGEYWVQFTREEIEKIHAKFMANLNNREKFNLEHNEKAVAPAYVLEAWLVGNDPSRDRSSSEFGIDVPPGTLMMVAQITDRKYYEQLVANDQIGFSIEGFLGLKFNHNAEAQLSPANNKSSKTMKKSQIKRKLYHALAFADGVMTPTGNVTVVADELKPGAPATVIDENGAPIPDYVGECLVNDTLVRIEKGVITDVVSGDTTMANENPENPMACEDNTSTPAGETATMGMDVMPNAKTGDNPPTDEEAKKKSMSDAPAAGPTGAAGYADTTGATGATGTADAPMTMAIDETELLTILQPKFDEIYKLIADLKVMVDAINAEEETDKVEEAAPLSVAQKLSAALKFLSK